MEMVRHTTVAPTANDFDSSVGSPLVVRSDTGALFVLLDSGSIFEIAGATANLVGDILTITDGTVTAKMQIVGTTAVIGSTSNHPLLIYVNNLEKARLTANGELLVGVTSANANGGTLQLKSGITFPATAVAATDVNTLDDYEEGTWVPADGSGAGLVITVNNATYTKVGRLVFLHANMTYPATADATAAKLSGLPFTVARRTVGAAVGASLAIACVAEAATTTMTILADLNAAVTNAQLTTATLIVDVVYEV